MSYVTGAPMSYVTGALMSYETFALMSLCNRCTDVIM